MAKTRRVIKVDIDQAVLLLDGLKMKVGFQTDCDWTQREGDKLIARLESFIDKFSDHEKEKANG